MQNILATQKQLHALHADIQRFIDLYLDHAIFRAPVLDYYNPEGYRQTTITGLKKFLSHAEAESSFVDGVSGHDIITIIEGTSTLLKCGLKAKTDALLSWPHL